MAKDWQVSALNELLEPMSTNIDSKMSKIYISPETSRMKKKTATGGVGISSMLFRESWTAAANQRGINRYAAD